MDVSPLTDTGMTLERIARQYHPDGQWLAEQIPYLLPSACDQERCHRDLVNFVLRGGRLPTELRALRYDPVALDLLVKLSVHSRFGVELATRDPRLFWDVVQDRQYRHVLGRRMLHEELVRQLQLVDTHQHRINTLVRYQYYHLLRIILGDIHQTLTFRAITNEISDLSDVLVDAALQLAIEHLRPRYGIADSAFVVLGMGKLGGRELNYSSDIDLIFCYDHTGETSGGRKTIEHHDYYRRVGAELISILDSHHPVGRLFRVDMRLRPHGASGELVLSIAETVEYYFNVGRAWERQALLKARPIAGTLALGNRLLDQLRPWVFPKDMVIDQLDDARTMRRRIEERSSTENVKTGAGGIRDIEFLVQFYQLGYGGHNPGLRQRATVPALRALGDVGLLQREDAWQLEQDYEWLRLVEHRLQMFEARQLHNVPQDDEQRLDLAIRCGFTGDTPLAEFDRELAAVQQRVRDCAERYYLLVSRDQDHFLALVSGEQVDPAMAEAVLRPYGFSNPLATARRLHAMAREPFFILRADRTERTWVQLLPELLSRLQGAPDIDEAIANFQRIVEAVGGRSTFYRTLYEQSAALDTVVNLAGWATFAVSELTRFSGLPDDVTHRLGDDLLGGAAGLADEATELVAGIADPLPNLGYFKARETVSAAVADLAGADPWAVWQHLSLVARAVLDGVLTVAAQTQAEMWGWPVLPGGRRCRFAVLGCGKLGGSELSYASDMDIIFVCDNGGICESSKPTTQAHDGEEFWTRVAKRLTRMCVDGRLYEIDPRLRPWGEQGQLVISLDGLRDYWAQPRDLWERMAMLRVAPVAGDTELATEACEIIRQAAIAAALPDDARAEVRSMRDRLEQSVGTRDHLKRGRGGYTDVEFLTFFSCLGAHTQDLPVGSSVAELLDCLQRIGRLPEEAAQACVESLTFMRQTEARMRLLEGSAISSIPTDQQQRLRFARCAGFTSVADMDVRLYFARQQARSWFDRVVPES